MPTDAPSPLPFLGLHSEERLRALADALPDGLFTTDADGTVTFWNRAAERITGWTRTEALGRSCAILAGDAVNGCACGVGPIRCGLAATSRSSKHCTIRTKDGRALVIVKNAVPLHAPDGGPIGALESFTEVGVGPTGTVGCVTPTVAAALAPGPRGPAAPAGDDASCCGMVGRSRAIHELWRTVGLVARSAATVMILGESGTGKELAAAAIHQLSPRAAGPFVRVSCSALSEDLLESELFGHVKGAFAGALRDRRGRFQDASGGTLFLDEIGDISPVVQVKLLRVIEQREIERGGDAEPIPVDVRLVCATHRDLKALVAEGRFRADLYFRLAVFPLHIPPLRERLEDLPLLAERFLRRGGSSAALSPEALRLLAAHAWPGNVRELHNVLEYAALQAGGGRIDPAYLPPELRAPPPAPAPPPDDARALRDALVAHGGNRTRAARALGISRVTLWKRMKRLGLLGGDDR